MQQYKIHGLPSEEEGLLRRWEEVERKWTKREVEKSYINLAILVVLPYKWAQVIDFIQIYKN